MPDESPQLFLSYGVRDASQIAKRLRCDLAARGYEVWQDVSRLRAGRPWDEDVPEGLRTSQVMIALLSPQSVRRALDAGNPTATDSVCLDEIAYARGSSKIPIIPVQVVSCEAPFLIYRLHQIDFRRWTESEAVYQAGLDQICAAVTEALHSRKSPERLWGPLPQPWDFTPFILEKRKHFVGREWLFQKIDRWRVTSPQSVLLIVGEPGIGKSAIVAALVHENPEGQVLAYHCCRADTPATLEPARFVRSIAAMVSARLEGFSVMLDDPVIKEALDRADTDPASAFEAAILSPLHEAPRPDGNRRYLLIDALDEALTHPKRPTIVEVLAARIKQLPSWVGIVATTRGESDVLRRLGGLPAHILEAEDPKNQDDVRAFIQRRLSESSLRAKAVASGKTLEELATGLLRSSAYNFLFVTTALDAVELGQLRLDEIERLPPDLSSLYEVFFDRLFLETGVSFQPTCQVLEVVAAARESLTRKQIAAVTGLDAEKELPPLLGRLAAFLPVREGHYSLFHRSLFEWLTGWDAQQDQSFAGPYHVSLQDGLKRLVDWGWAEYKHGVQNASLYCLRHLVAHLHEADRNDQARTVLLDFHWLQAKLEASDVNALIADYDYLPEDKNLQLVQSAIRLSAHVVARDPRLLAGQLIGRLLGDTSSEIQALLNEAVGEKPWLWLRPLMPSLAPANGPLIRTLEGHADGVHAVVVTCDGCRIVSAGGSSPSSGRQYDCTLRVWNLESGQMLSTLEGHTSSVTTVAVTPDGCRVISGSHRDETLRVWALESGRTLRTIQCEESPKPPKWDPEKVSALLRAPRVQPGGLLGLRVTAMAVMPDGRRAVSGVSHGIIRVWDLESGQTLCTLQGHTASITAVAGTPDGRCAVSASDDHTLRVWDLESCQTLRTLCTLQGHTASITAVAVTPDGQRAVSASDDHTLRVWDLKSCQTLRTLQGHTASVHAVAVTPDGRRAVSGSSDCTLRVWDLDNGRTVYTPEGYTTLATALAVTPDGRRVVSASHDHTLRVWDLESGQTLCTLQGHTASIHAVALTPDGRRAVSASDEPALRLWDLESGRVLCIVKPSPTKPETLAITPDGHRVVLVSGGIAIFDKNMWLFDPERDQTLREMCQNIGPQCVTALALTPDGRRVLSGWSEGMLRVLDLESGQVLLTLLGHAAPSQLGPWGVRPSVPGHVTAVAVTPDGCRALSGSADKTLRMYDLKTGYMLCWFEGHTARVTALAVTPDGRRAVSASDDHTLRVWDLQSRQILHTLKGHTDSVTTLALTFDGHRALSGSADNTLRMWELDGGAEITSFVGEAQISTCAFGPDGRTIVARDYVGHVHHLRLEGVNETKPPIGNTKIPLLHRKE
jgi:WD40 repeat protein